MKDKQVKAIIAGAGSRAMKYASFGLKNPDKLKITGVVEPDKFRRERASRVHKIPKQNCFSDVSELTRKGRIADTVINGTMDRDHYKTSVPLLESGYNMLLEKPITTSISDLLSLWDTVKKNKNKVMICHVLRYAPFYAEIKKRILSGDIGRIINIQTAEHVSYHHMSGAFVRGKWNNRYENSTFLMQKCCHDLDIITWFMSGIKPVSVYSCGSLMEFKSENAPKGAGTRCLVDCPLEPECNYSAGKIYLDMKKWPTYAWRSIERIKNPDREDKIKSLKTDNPHGRCIWKCNISIVDHQSVTIFFKNGTTVTHNLVGGTSRPCRKIHILGTKGEIEGVTEESEFVIRHPDPRKGHEYSEERIKLNIGKDMHGGGDMRLVEDFVKIMQEKKPSISTTDINDSIYGHLIGFNADKSMDNNCVVNIDTDI